MRDIVLSITAAVLLLGCSSKEEEKFLTVYEKNKNYHMQLQKTEKTKLTDGNYTKALLTATYLFEPIEDKNDTREEMFVVGLYLDDDEGTFESGEYNLTLNGTVPKSVKSLSRNDPYIKTISFASEWTDFYLFTFPHTKAKSFKLIFNSELYGKGELHFAKVAKYVLTKTPF
jgi:hypothetical protein